MKIITQQLAEDIPKNHALLANQVVNPQNFAELFKVLRAVQNLTVYDITKTKAHPPKSIIKVKDHINRTGENPLISHQKKLNIEFVKKQLSMSDVNNFAKLICNPQIMSYGQILYFKSMNFHGTEENISNKHRLSFDFRILKMSYRIIVS